MVSGLAVLYPVHKALDAYLVSQYRPTYREAEFVVDRVVAADDSDPEARPHYWAEGTIEPGAIAHKIGVLRTLDGRLVLRDDPAVPARGGRRMRIWWSDVSRAPSPSVASMPCLPDESMATFWLVFAIGLLFVGMRLTVRVGRYLQKEYRTETLFDERR